MKNHLLILTALCLLVVQTTFSQAICGFDGVHKKLLDEDPQFRKNIAATEASMRKYIAANRSKLEMRVTDAMAALYTIPVVVHVVHTGGAIGTIYNPTDAQINGAINYLNQVYNGTYPGTTGVGDLQIQFVLAQRDPNCNPTNGINRINGSGISGYTAGGVNFSTGLGTSEANIKNLIRWSTSSYYNIWIVNKIDGADGTSGQFIAGYAQFPGGNVNTDGTVMLATQMTTGQKTLPHEIGHAFSLYHPFEGSPDKNTCPNNTSCSVNGDQVCDTDPITYNQLGGVVDFTCRTGTNLCGGTYSTNTEENYMNYTSCFHLFTAGQKARLLASAASADRSGLSASLGATPTYSAPVCTPKINFEFTEIAPVTEATGASSGCRSYTDYTYNMVIGSNPSAVATATLNIASGTATEGVDFDITTNGNFTTPSKIITFPTGGHAAQTFTVRIYDDAIVESAETFTLGFTVNSGGGNAVKGDGRINLLLGINDNDAAPYAPFNSTKSIGGYAYNLQSPFAGTAAKQKSQFLYTAAELIAAGIPTGNIVGLSLNILKNTGASFVYQGLTIKIGHTVLTALTPVSDASFTTVYSADYSTVNGLNSFTFSTPFGWDGTSNIIVEICYDNGATTSASNDNCQGYIDAASPTVKYLYQSGINCAGSFSSWSQYPSGNKPNIQFTYPDPGTQLQTTLNVSRQEYLGPNADVYFYDQATNKLMARISNTSSFDYGCTQVLVDRNVTSAGANAVAFWNNTTSKYLLSRTLKVNPTTNNPSGTYNISLYYTQAEINAWQTATGQSAGNLQVYKVASQISDVTPASPAGGGTVTVATPAISTLGTNTVLTASFSNGFSGFGAGVAGSSALPVRLLDFKGNLRANTVALDWSTTAEINSQYFDIERSSDGVVFSKIGTVQSAGNSSNTRYYSFTDNAPGEHNYYRLKQVDIDGKSEYSKVILVDNKNQDSNFRIINNPFTDVLDMQFTKIQTGKMVIRLLDVAGKEIYHTTSDASGQSRLRVNLGGRNISAGIYVLQVTTSNEQFIERVMKQ